MHQLLQLLLVIAAHSANLAQAAPSAERRAVVFYTAETHGTLEPCGCTSDPLGDFARVTALIRAEAKRSKAAILVDAGSVTYPSSQTEGKSKSSDSLRADFLARELVKLPLGGIGLGESDLIGGTDAIIPKRLAINLTPAPFVEPSRIVDVGRIKIGVLGIVDIELARKAGLNAQDPGIVAQQEVARLRTAGAEVIILLAPVERQFARSLARQTGADIVIVGKKVGRGMARSERVGAAYLVAPGDELQHIGRLEIVLRGKTPHGFDDPIIDAGGPSQAQERIAELERSLAQLDTDLARWQKETGSDPAFVSQKFKERDELRAEQSRLGSGRWQAPASGSYFTNTLIPIRRSLPRDPTLSASMRKLDRAIGKANLRAAEPPPPAEPGRASFVGGDKCVSCHKPAARFWKRTAHAHAWNTLVQVGKEAHYDCVNCHVTGYGEVGGSSLGHTKELTDIQCEVCHGPNSIHIEKRGKETPYAGRLKTPESVCTRCHNEKHSDTFQYEAYMREVIGPGHGEDARDKLGAGPTGSQLRRAAEARARTATSKQTKP
jgi:hypothetical protein